MAGEPEVTIIGNVTGDPELRFTPSGAAVANFTVAQTPRNFNKSTNEYEDGETLFMRCAIWRDAAENVAESITKGTRVIVRGRLKQRSYEKDGQQRTVIEMEVDEVGPSLRYASAKVTKTQRSGGQQGGQQAGGWGGQQPAQGGWGGQQQGGQQPDPWASQQPAQQQQRPPQQGGWQGGPPDYGQPPF